MDFPPDQVDVALKTLRSIIERIRVQAGCLRCSVYLDSEIETRIIFSQEWRNEEDLQNHLRSDEYRQVLLIMETAITPPLIRFDTITSSSGVETIEKARGRKDK
jgi:quinol monooxygenase YgiN